MQFTPAVVEKLAPLFHVIKEPVHKGPAAQNDPAVAATVSRMLRDIESGGIDAVLRYASQLDGTTDPHIEMSATEIAHSGDALPADLRSAIELGSSRTRAFATEQRLRLQDWEVEHSPGLVAGTRYVPVGRVGAYLPAGRFPLTASAFMTVGVAKEAGVPTVLACTPPQPGGGANSAVAYAAYLSGVDRLFVLGGVQALAAMAFGLLGDLPVNMIVGAGNAYVAEAKRQLFGAVAIDLLAGPSEVAVISDDSADPELVAADLLGQAEHGPNSPAALVTTSHHHAQLVIEAVERQLETLATAEIAGAAWRDYGLVVVADTRDVAIELMDDLAPEHLEVMTEDDDYFHDRLRNYGSLFVGPWSTVAYSDKGMAGTNHVLPTAGGAKHSAGLSVSRFVKPLTFQRVSRAATAELAPATIAISESEGMAAHRATAAMRVERVAAEATGTAPVGDDSVE